jgi:hypothetical protein
MCGASTADGQAEVLLEAAACRLTATLTATQWDQVVRSRSASPHGSPFHGRGRAAGTAFERYGSEVGGSNPFGRAPTAQQTRGLQPLARSSAEAASHGFLTRRSAESRERAKGLALQAHGTSTHRELLHGSPFVRLAEHEQPDLRHHSTLVIPISGSSTWVVLASPVASASSLL